MNNSNHPLSNHNKPHSFLSLGAGVQSSTLALMAAHEEITPPEAAIFADTGAEPQAVYDYLNWLETILPFPIYRVMHRNGITKEIEAVVNGESNRISNPPFFVKSNSKHGMLKRRCTQDYKINPINKKIRELVGLKPRQQSKRILAISYIGISLDEIQRCKYSRMPWIKHQWPLIEKRMNRHDCLTWLKKHNYHTPPRSACIYCPYHSDAEFRQMQKHDPHSFKEAIRIDNLIRNKLPFVKSETFIHSSCKPLSAIDFTSKDHQSGQLSFWNNECDGTCGV